MSYKIDTETPHLCLVCGKPNARISGYGYGSGIRVDTECPDCKAIGKITNMSPWYGTELPIDKLKAMFTLAGTFGKPEAAGHRSGPLERTPRMVMGTLSTKLMLPIWPSLITKPFRRRLCPLLCSTPRPSSRSPTGSRT